MLEIKNKLSYNLKKNELNKRERLLKQNCFKHKIKIKFISAIRRQIEIF